MWKYRFNGPGSDELMHFGIKGQKWGIRRFQYENGSYTEEGKSRYQRGKSLNKEFQQRLGNELKKYKESNEKEIERISDKMHRLEEKYDLDGDDGGGGDTEHYSEAELAKAKKEWQDLLEKWDWLENDYGGKSYKKVKKFMEKKYGDQVMSDIDYYNKKHNQKLATIFIGGYAALFLSAIFLPRAIEKHR